MHFLRNLLSIWLPVNLMIFNSDVVPIIAEAMVYGDTTIMLFGDTTEMDYGS